MEQLDKKIEDGKAELEALVADYNTLNVELQETFKKYNDHLTELKTTLSQLELKINRKDEALIALNALKEEIDPKPVAETAGE